MSYCMVTLQQLYTLSSVVRSKTESCSKEGLWNRYKYDNVNSDINTRTNNDINSWNYVSFLHML